MDLYSDVRQSGFVILSVHRLSTFLFQAFIWTHDMVPLNALKSEGKLLEYFTDCESHFATKQRSYYGMKVVQKLIRYKVFFVRHLSVTS